MPIALSLQQAFEIPPRMARRVGRNVFRRAHAHHLSPARAAFGAHVDDPVGGFDDVQVVLDHHRIENSYSSRQ